MGVRNVTTDLGVSDGLLLENRRSARCFQLRVKDSALFVLLVSHAIETIATCAFALRSKFKPLLIDILYLLVEVTVDTACGNKSSFFCLSTPFRINHPSNRLQYSIQ